MSEMNETKVNDYQILLGSSIISETKFLGETTLEVTKDNLRQVLALLKKVPDPGFEVLMDLSGVDYLKPEKRTQVFYWLHNPTTFQRVRVISYVPRGESLPSVVDLWKGADWYECELFDLFGIKFEGHPDLKRILMPDNWVGHPLRKDYALTEEPVEFKNGVKPKVPSEIIPKVRNRDRFNQLGFYGRD